MSSALWSIFWPITYIKDTVVQLIPTPPSLGALLLNYIFSRGKRPYVALTAVEPEVVKFIDLLAPGADAGTPMETILVSPSQPTIAGDITSYPLLGTDILRMHFCQVAYLVPEIINVDRYRAALADTLAHFPTFAGRLVISPSNERTIALTNSPVPLVVDHDARGPAIGDYTTIGYHLGSYLAPINLAALENHDEPLISIKLSMFPKTNETVIGVMASHQVSDGYRLHEFLVTLSNHYQGIFPEKIPEFIIPSPAPLSNVSLKQIFDLVSALKNDPRWKTNSYSEVQAYEKSVASLEASVPVDIRISAKQMAKLKSQVVANLKAKNPADDVTVSRQDVVTAFIVATLNKFLDIPINHVRSVWNYRGVTKPNYYGGNAIGLSMTEVIPEEDLQDISVIAREIRIALLRARSDEEFSLMLPLMHLKLTDVANRGQFIGSVLPPGRFVTNSDVNTNWRAAHFGHPDTVKFFSAHKENRYARVYQSNPEIVDGKVVDPRTGSIDLHVRVDAHIRDAFVASIAETLRSLD